MIENRYVERVNSIKESKYGVKVIRLVNTFSALVVYATYPIFLIRSLVKGDSNFLMLLLVPGISFVLLSVFRNYANRPRPYEVYDFLPIIEKDTKGKSFPSRHVFSVFVIAGSIYFVSQGLGVFLMFLGLLISIVRVLGGVHFPRDVIAGGIIGLVSSIIGWSVSIF